MEAICRRCRRRLWRLIPPLVPVSLLLIGLNTLRHGQLQDQFRLSRDWVSLPDDVKVSARERFRMWDSFSQNLLPPETLWNNSKRLLIYRCDDDVMSHCGGWADRIKGALFAYLIANLTRRAFKFDMQSPACGIEFFLQPNRVDWRLPNSFRFQPQLGKIFKKTDNDHFLFSVHAMDFQQELGQDDIVYFQGNRDYITRLRQNLLYSKQLSWMRHKSPSDIYAAIYKHLFRLSPRLQRQIHQILTEHLPSKEHRLVCAQVRMGRNPSIKDDTAVRYSSSRLESVWKFLEEKAPSDKDVVFVMSDSEEVVQAARNQSFAHKLVTVPGQIRHIDKIQLTSFQDVCSAFDRLMLEFHLLMTCHILVKANSGLSSLASFVRGSDRGLFCLFYNGSILPCKRDFDQFFM